MQSVCFVEVFVDFDGSGSKAWTIFRSWSRHCRVGIQFFFRKKGQLWKLNKNDIGSILLLDWWKSRVLEELRGEFFFYLYLNPFPPNKKSWFFEGQRCRRHMYRLWLIKFGQAASVAESMPLWLVFCEIRSYTIREYSSKVIHNDTVVHQVVSRNAFGHVQKQFIHISPIYLAC